MNDAQHLARIGAVAAISGWFVPGIAMWCRSAPREAERRIR